MTSSAMPDPAPGALEVFAAWLSAREGGDPIEFADLVAQHPALAAELEELHASWKELATGEDLSLAPPPRTDASDATVLVSRLTARETSFRRYKLEREVARGGMGAILRVYDEDFRRPLAMKVALGEPVRGAPGAPTGESRLSPKLLARFLAEAQITGQLDHPGIVPVHELGLDDAGRLYFTMKLVEGRDLKHIFDLVFADREGWNLTRALGVILKACEAIAYAHKKGVIHRDLKPANIMVGSFGEVFVMDWGLARVLGRDDARDFQAADGEGPGERLVRTDRDEVGDRTPDSGLLTLDGDVLGTAAYMPPEQARGAIEELTARSDVYSIGAMLYHLLSRQVPYMAPGSRPSQREVLRQVLAGPPRPLNEIDASLPGELVAICEKAMARDPDARYPETLALGDDLRAYLERRVVAAYETGAFAELKKWIARNRSLALAIAALALSLVIGLIVSSSLFVKAKEETARADEKASEAEQRTDDVLSLSAIQDLHELVDRADSAWPAHPQNIAKYEAWLAAARTLIDGRPPDVARAIKGKPSLADHKRKLAEIELRGRARAVAAGSEADTAIAVWDFESSQDRWWHAQLARLITDLEEFSDSTTGLLSAGVNPAHGWGVEKRLEFARTIEAASVSGARARELWAEALASIADRAQCPRYDGLSITPQLGLLPIGRDPASGLWEFAHLQTGEIPARESDGRLRIDFATGLVFVLVPGGDFAMGAQRDDSGRPGFDPDTAPNESPRTIVSLDPYFLSKYEMTQAQWLRFCGANPSDNAAGTDGSKPITPLHPVERVTWVDASAILERLHLMLPTEAQWERAARGGTATVFPTGDAPESLIGYANLADAFCKSHGGPAAWEYDEWLDDGYARTSPAGSYLANAFGFHDTVGNVWEWCRDAYPQYTLPIEPGGEGLRLRPDPRYRSCRGGSFSDVAVHSRCSTRQAMAPGDRDGGLGLRPARGIVR